MAGRCSCFHGARDGLGKQRARGMGWETARRGLLARGERGEEGKRWAARRLGARAGLCCGSRATWAAEEGRTGWAARPQAE
jgi:hypothetical protein